MDFDITTFAGIAAATTAAIQGLKQLLPDQMGGKEKLVALVLPLSFGIVAKLTGAFGTQEWVQFVLSLVMAGLTSQVAYDKVVSGLVEAPKEEEVPKESK